MGRRGWWVVAGLLVGLAGGIARATVSVQQTTMGCTPSEVDIAWNPASEYNLIWGGTGCVDYTTNWVFTALGAATTPPPTGGFDPRMAFSRNGAFFSEMFSVFGIETDSVYKSTDSGNTWAGTTHVPFQDGETIGNDPIWSTDDVICSVSLSSPDLPFVSPRLGADRNSSSPHANYLYASAAVFTKARSASTCQDAPQSRHWAIVRSTDNGATWSTPDIAHQLINGGESEALAASELSGFATDPNGNVTTVGKSSGVVGFNPNLVACGVGLRTHTSTDGGLTGWHLANDSCVINNPNVSPVPYPDVGFPDTAQIASDGVHNGTWYVVFRGKRYAGTTNEYHVWFTKTTNGGSGSSTTWSAPVKVDTVALGATDGALRGQELAISVSSNGRIDVAYSDPRNSTSGVYYNYSSDGGSTFQSTDTLLSGTVSAPTGTYINLVSGPPDVPGVAFATYKGTVSGVEHAYVTSITIS